MEDKILANAEAKSRKAVDVLAALVKIPSLTGEELKAQEFVAGYLTNLGLEVELWEPDLKELFARYPAVAQYPSHWKHDLILPYQYLPTFDDLVKSGKMDVLNGSAYFGSEAGSVAKVMDFIRHAVSEAGKKDPWLAEMPPEVFFLHHDDPSDIDENQPIVQTLATAAEQVSGERPLRYRGTAACDMRHLINQGKIPTTVFGPGWGDQAHKPDEFMPLDSMVPAVKTLALTIYKWCK